MEIKASVIPAKEKVKEVELVALLTNIQKYPAIYTSANTLVKFEAWQQVARQLGMEGNQSATLPDFYYNTL